MKLLFALTLVASLSGCAAFCNSEDYGCIAKQHAIAEQAGAGALAVLAGAAAYQATRPVYVEPVVVVPVRRCYGYYCY
jgi:hypothetical protein